MIVCLYVSPSRPVALLATAISGVIEPSPPYRSIGTQPGLSATFRHCIPSGVISALTASLIASTLV